MRVCERIKDYIDLRGISVAELANMIHMGTGKLCKLLSGEQKMSLHTFSYICLILGEPPDKFLIPHKIISEEL